MRKIVRPGTMKQPQICAFYKFIPLTLDQLPSLREQIENKLASLGFYGLFLLGVEGLNATILGEADRMDEIKNFLQTVFGPIEFKDSPGKPRAFLRLRVKIREEIVTLNRPGLVPQDKSRHLSPQEWHKKMQEPGVRILDTRNDYEVEIGKFRNAEDFSITEFHAFPEKLKNSNFKKDETVLIYCTGGIRCEKAILEMNEQGYENVFQLDGGILKYIEEFKKDGLFDGECFVFDHRVAVTNQLQPSEKYRLCPHCGQPGVTAIDCDQCGRPEIVCDKCLEKSPHYKTCSRNCAHHHRMGHVSRRIHWDSVR